jgi:hypothetical protein
LALLQRLYAIITSSAAPCNPDISLDASGLVTLWAYAFVHDFPTDSRESQCSRGVCVLSPKNTLAMRCLANAVTLSEPARRLFVELGYPIKLVPFFKMRELDRVGLVCVFVLSFSCPFFLL